MKTATLPLTIDKGGRVVIPRATRIYLNISEGDIVEVTITGHQGPRKKRNNDEKR